MSQREDPVKELEQAHEHWLDLYKNGGYDPFWPDGTNLNLVRNHMIYYKRQIEEQYGVKEKPAIYYRALPDKVDNQYMAKKDEILQKAKSLYHMLTQMPEAYDLKTAKQYMGNKELQDLNILNAIKDIVGLEEAIAEEDYVRMRGLSWNIDERIEEVKTAHELLMNRQHQEGEQMTIFDRMM